MIKDSQRREEFAHIGGHPALDLVNTVQWRISPTRRADDLRDYEDVVRWAEQLKLVTDVEAEALRTRAASSPDLASDEWMQVGRLRETIYSALFEGTGSPALVEAYREAIGYADLAPHDEHWTWSLPVDLSLPRLRVAIEALDLVMGAKLTQLAQCQDAECGWVFLDTSSRRNRRWCVSADCGNRNRVREYYARSRGDSPSALRGSQAAQPAEL
jgi:predicted RNA-binding Zn ribbon-like protein